MREQVRVGGTYLLMLLVIEFDDCCLILEERYVLVQYFKKNAEKRESIMSR